VGAVLFHADEKRGGLRAGRTNRHEEVTLQYRLVHSILNKT
jgi:hypothetical protein